MHKSISSHIHIWEKKREQSLALRRRPPSLGGAAPAGLDALLPPAPAEAEPARAAGPACAGAWWRRTGLRPRGDALARASGGSPARWRRSRVL